MKGKLPSAFQTNRITWAKKNRCYLTVIPTEFLLQYMIKERRNNVNYYFYSLSSNSITEALLTHY
jgi:hypothetical protein